MRCEKCNLEKDNVENSLMIKDGVFTAVRLCSDCLLIEEI